MKTGLETWAAGDAYEQYMGRWSAEIARLFLESLAAPANSGWLDVGCGTGALTRVILASAQAKQVIGLDLSLDFVSYAKEQNREAEFINASATALPICDARFDFVVSGLALNFVPQVEQALLEFVRVVKPNGKIAAYLWDYAGQMEFLRYFWDAAVALDPAAASLHEGQRFPICQPNELSAVWQAAGLSNVSVQALDIMSRFDNFEAYWQSFTVGKFPAPQYALSLNEQARAELRELLQKTLPVKTDGSIQLIARAWAVFGEKTQ